MKPEQNWFNGREFFPRGVCISSHTISLKELDKIGDGSPPSGAEMADDSIILNQVDRPPHERAGSLSERQEEGIDSKACGCESKPEG